MGALVAERAATDGDRVFVHVDGADVTYREFDAMITDAAHAFRSLGVVHGDRVAIALPNGLDHLVVAFGLMRLGAVAVPLSEEYRDPQVAFTLRDADTGVLVATAAFVEEHRAAVEPSGVRTVVLTDGAAGHSGPYAARDWRTLLAEATPDGSLPSVAPSDPLAIIYTSGTTGDPKGVLLCHEHQRTIAENIAGSVDLTARDCFYNFFPLHHNTGLGIITGAVLSVGARMLLIGRFSRTSFWPDVVRHGCTVFYGMGPIVEILEKDPDADRAALGHRLRVCFGIAIDDGQAARFGKRFGVGFVSGYGSTEVNMVAIAPMDGRHPGAAGRVLDDFEVAVVDDADRPLPAGQVGEVVVRPRRPFITSLGYWRKPEETVRAWRNLWAHTGDAGRLDEDGHLYFVDRIKDVIRHRGNNVSSLEVENVILALAGVAEVAVIPVPSELGGFDQDVCAVVVPRAGIELEPRAVVEACARQLPKYAVPRYVELTGELPKTPTGKVRKVLLRAAEPSAARFDRNTPDASPRHDERAGS